MEISHYTDGRLKTERVHLIDYKDIDNNLFIVTNQLTIKGQRHEETGHHLVCEWTSFGCDRAQVHDIGDE